MCVPSRLNPHNQLQNVTLKQGHGDHPPDPPLPRRPFMSPRRGESNAPSTIWPSNSSSASPNLVTQEDDAWIQVNSKKAKKMNRFKQNIATDNMVSKSSIKRKQFSSPSYMTKLKNKQAQHQFAGPERRSEDPALQHFYDYAKKSFPLLTNLRKPTQLEVKMLQLMKEGRLQLSTLPQFLTQIMSSKNIARLSALLIKKHTAELFAPLAPGHHISKELPGHAIMRNICISGDVPPSITDNLASFKNDVSDVYYIAKKRILVFSFASNEKAQFWNNKEIPFQNKPITLGYYFNSEIHQKLPPVYAANLFEGKTQAEKLQLVASLRTKVHYKFALVNVSPFLKQHHLESLLVDTLHLRLGSISASVNRETGLRRKSTWEIILQTEGCPAILLGKSSIQWSAHKVMIYHHSVQTSLPCTKCYAMTHIYAKCQMTNDTQKKLDKVLQLVCDTDYKTPILAYLPEDDEDVWINITNNKTDDNFIAHTKREAQLDQYALKEDIDTLYNLRSKKNKKQIKKRNNNKHVSILRKNKAALMPKFGPASKDQSQEQSRMQCSFDDTLEKIIHFMGPRDDAFGAYIVTDQIVPQERSLTKDHLIWKENCLMTSNDFNVGLPIKCQSLHESKGDMSPVIPPMTSETKPSIISVSPSVQSTLSKPNHAMHQTITTSSTTSALSSTGAKSIGQNSDQLLLSKRTTQNTAPLVHQSSSSLMSHFQPSPSAEFITSKQRITDYFGASSLPKQTTIATTHEKRGKDITATTIVQPRKRKTVQEQQQIIRDLSLLPTEVPGTGHCFWVALLLGHYDISLQHFPSLNQAEESNLKELKLLIRDNIDIAMDELLLSTTCPLMDKLILNAKSKQITRKERRHCLETYFDTICCTDSSTVLTYDYWGCSSLLNIVSHALKKVVYVLDFSNPWTTTLLQKYDYIQNISIGICEAIPFEKWNTELMDNSNNMIVLGFKGNNHFMVYRFRGVDMSPTSLSEETLPSDTLNLRNSHKIDDDDVTSDIELSGFTDLTGEEKPMAQNEYHDHNMQDVYPYADHDQLEPLQANRDLLHVCEQSAPKKVLEDKTWKGHDVPISLPDSSGEEYTDTTTGCNEVPKTTSDSIAVAVPSPSSQVLMKKEVIALLPEDVLQRRKIALASLLKETWEWCVQYSKRPANLTFKKWMEGNKASWKFFQKMGHTHPDFLLQVIASCDSPVLFLKQLSPKTVLDLGRYVLCQNIIEYLTYLTQFLTTKRQLSILHGWLATVKIITVLDSKLRMLSSSTQWEKLLKVYPDAASHWAAIDNNVHLPLVCLIDTLFPGYFYNLEHDSTYLVEVTQIAVYPIPSLWSLCKKKQLILTVLDKMANHDLSGLRNSLKQFQYHKCLTIRKALQY